MADPLKATMADGKEEKQIVQFVKSRFGYNQGEIAGFVPKKAQGLRELGAVRFLTLEEAKCIEKGEPYEPPAPEPEPEEEKKEDKRRGRRGG